MMNKDKLQKLRKKNEILNRTKGGDLQKGWILYFIYFLLLLGLVYASDPKDTEKKQDNKENGIPKERLYYLLYIYIYIVLFLYIIELWRTKMKMQCAPINKDIVSRVQTHWAS